MSVENENKLEDQPITPVGDEDGDIVDVTDLSLEDIEKLEKEEEGAEETPPKPESDEGEEDKPPKPDGEESESDEDKTETEEEEKPDERSDFEKEIDAEEDVTKLRERLKGLHGLATKEKQTSADLRKQLQETKSKLHEKSKKEFEELDEEQLEELKNTDADAYIEYLEAKKQHEKDVEDGENELLQQTVELQAQEAVDFAKNVFNVDLDFSVKPEDQPDAIKKLVAEGGPLNQIESYLQENVIPKDNVYTAKQMEDAYKILFHDEIVKNAKKGVREQTLNDIEDAASGGSKFDRASGSGGGKDGGKINEDELTNEDIANLTEAQCDRILAED